jgi:hypothetical protein
LIYMTTDLILTQTDLQKLVPYAVVLLQRDVLPYEAKLLQDPEATLTITEQAARASQIMCQVKQHAKFQDIGARAGTLLADCVYAHTAAFYADERGNRQQYPLVSPTMPCPDGASYISGQIILPPLRGKTARDYWAWKISVMPEVRRQRDVTISVLHEIGHGRFPFSAAQTQTPLGEYSSEVYAEIYALKKYEAMGGHGDIIKSRLAWRSLAAFTGSVAHESWLAPACFAIMQRQPVPDYRDVLWSYSELQDRAFNPEIAATATPPDSAAWRDNIKQNFGDIDITAEAYDFTKRRFNQNPHHYFAALAKILATPQITNPLTAAIGAQVWRGYEHFCPERAARALRKHGAPHYHASI